MRRQAGIADGWLLLAGLLFAAGLVTTAIVAGTSYLKGVEQKGYLRGQADEKFKAEAAALAAQIHNTTKANKANEENDVLRNTLAAERARVRNLTARINSRLMPTTPSAEAPPLNGALPLDALRAFVTGVGDLVGEGAEAITDLNTAKRWANDL